jgi:hypothetical protein
MTTLCALRWIAIAALFTGTAESRAAEIGVAGQKRNHTVQVAGSGVDHLDTAIVHSQQPTETGMIQRSTETVELTGDLHGRVLYHVTSVFDFARGTLVNKGDQVYSGTIAGSRPVLIHDDAFRFEVNLVTGEESGQVYLFNHLAGPKVRCTLEVVGTGVNSAGNPTFDYTGECIFRG